MKPVLPGNQISLHGITYTVGAVGVTQGERCYWLIDKHGTVSMLPAFIIELQTPNQR